ncbi:SGNH/GDSL hydrolase family protein [Nocardioides sp. R1-1]|uniref:SGNH/GDSL hydrolase family protein n=1 Tax=Nocardioides sp. R1-1 TaxID=3383502 RepID=UPI0038D22EA1
MSLARLRAFVRLRRARLRGWLALFRMLLAALRGRVDEIWVGDSHSVTFNTAQPPLPGILRTAERRWTWHLGPRVMYSIARDDFPPTLLRTARLVARVPGARDAAWFFSFGEIDIRCHLAPRLAQGADADFVATYVERVRGLVGRLGTRTGTIVVPVPPCLDSYDHAAFPVAGSPEERLVAHGAVRTALTAAVDATPGLRLLDVTEALAGPDGLMRDELTDDGCHTNAAGRAAVRHEVSVLLRATLPRPRG